MVFRSAEIGTAEGDYRQHAAGLERGMRDAPDMPELEKDQAALGVHGVDHPAPALDLRVRIDAGHARTAMPVAITGEASAMIRPPGVARWA